MFCTILPTSLKLTSLKKKKSSNIDMANIITNFKYFILLSFPAGFYAITWL